MTVAGSGPRHNPRARLRSGPDPSPDRHLHVRLAVEEDPSRPRRVVLRLAAIHSAPPHRRRLRRWPCPGPTVAALAPRAQPLTRRQPLQADSRRRRLDVASRAVMLPATPPQPPPGVDQWAWGRVGQMEWMGCMPTAPAAAIGCS